MCFTIEQHPEVQTFLQVLSTEKPYTCSIDIRTEDFQSLASSVHGITSSVLRSLAAGTLVTIEVSEEDTLSLHASPTDTSGNRTATA